MAARNVQRMAATHFSFAAICGDGSVVTWGRQACGDSYAVQEQLAGRSARVTEGVVVLFFGGAE